MPHSASPFACQYDRILGCWWQTHILFEGDYYIWKSPWKTDHPLFLISQAATPLNWTISRGIDGDTYKTLLSFPLSVCDHRIIQHPQSTASNPPFTHHRPSSTQAVRNTFNCLRFKSPPTQNKRCIHSSHPPPCCCQHGPPPPWPRPSTVTRAPRARLLLPPQAPPHRLRRHRRHHPPAACTTSPLARA